MVKVDLGCHPANFFDEMRDYITLMKQSRIPEMQLAGRSLEVEMNTLIRYMEDHAIGKCYRSR